MWTSATIKSYSVPVTFFLIRFSFSLYFNPDNNSYCAFSSIRYTLLCTECFFPPPTSVLIANWSLQSSVDLSCMKVWLDVVSVFMCQHLCHQCFLRCIFICSSLIFCVHLSVPHVHFSVMWLVFVPMSIPVLLEMFFLSTKDVDRVSFVEGQESLQKPPADKWTETQRSLWFSLTC